MYPCFFRFFILLAALKVRFLSQETHTSKHLPAAERSQPPPATRRLETWHTDQMTDFIKHASEKHCILAFLSLSLSYRVYRTKVRLSGAVLGKAKLCASDQVLSKAPRGVQRRRTTEQGWNSTLQRQNRDQGECLHKRSGSYFSLLQHYPLLTEQQPMRRSSRQTPICARSEQEHSHRKRKSERESERETARCSLRPPSSPAATPRERSGIGLNKEASSDGQTVPAPPIQRVGIGWRCGWVGGIEERVGGEKRRRDVVYVTIIRFLYKPPRLIRGLRIKFTRELTVTVWPSVNPHPPQHPRVTSCFHTFNGRTCVLTRITPRPPIIDKLGLLSV